MSCCIQIGYGIRAETKGEWRKGFAECRAPTVCGICRVAYQRKRADTRMIRLAQRFDVWA